MGRLFLVEFDDFNSGKFYVCKDCSTPFARNTDVYNYWKGPGNLVEVIILFSDARRISNLVDSGVIHLARETQEDHDWQEFRCVACNNWIGVKFMRPEPQEPFTCYSLYSRRLLFRMNGIENDPEIITPEEWFDLPRPPGEWLF